MELKLLKDFNINNYILRKSHWVYLSVCETSLQ